MTETSSKKASLHDVARAAGVSISTVSRALAHPERLSAKTRDKVLAVTRELGYHPNIAARNLRLGHTKTLLAVMPNHKATSVSTITTEAQYGIGAQCRKQGYALNVVHMDDTEATADHVLQLAYGGQASGLILMAEQPYELHGRRLQDCGLPIVSLSEDLTHLNIPSVVTSDRQSMMDAIDTLADLGHTSFYFISGPDNSYHSRQREAGVRSGLIRRFGSDTGLQKFRADFSVQSGIDAAEAYLALDDRPSAVICWADEAAIGFQSAILNAGLAIPGDLSLISFDGLTASRYMRPPICTFDQNMTDLGAQAAQLLIDMIDSGEPPKGASIEYPAKLFPGGSIAPI
ncbi:MAG: LacI family DNA-binding transcriptional regulator [Rhodobacteraceae bacterium]|nr:LacI family DNA-binding transcriptional regulator [Paracoccaceae bacterium]